MASTLARWPRPGGSTKNFFFNNSSEIQRFDVTGRSAAQSSWSPSGVSHSPQVMLKFSSASLRATSPGLFGSSMWTSRRPLKRTWGLQKAYPFLATLARRTAGHFEPETQAASVLQSKLHSSINFTQLRQTRLWPNRTRKSLILARSDPHLICDMGEISEAAKVKPGTPALLYMLQARRAGEVCGNDRRACPGRRSSSGSSLPDQVFSWGRRSLRIRERRSLISTGFDELSQSAPVRTRGPARYIGGRFH